MRHAVPFAQILDDALGADVVASATSDRTSRPVQPRVLGYFFLTIPAVEPVRVPRSRPFRFFSDDSTVRQCDCRRSDQSFPRHRIRRPLSSRERRAFDELVLLGASLASDFSHDELRRAFRGLARRYHPDRHHGSSEAEKARLSALFTRAHDSYRVLLGREAHR